MSGLLPSYWRYVGSAVHIITVAYGVVHASKVQLYPAASMSTTVQTRGSLVAVSARTITFRSSFAQLDNPLQAIFLSLLNGDPSYVPDVIVSQTHTRCALSNSNIWPTLLHSDIRVNTLRVQHSSAHCSVGSPVVPAMLTSEDDDAGSNHGHLLQCPSVDHLELDTLSASIGGHITGRRAILAAVHKSLAARNMYITGARRQVGDGGCMHVSVLPALTAATVTLSLDRCWLSQCYATGKGGSVLIHDTAASVFVGGNGGIDTYVVFSDSVLTEAAALGGDGEYIMAWRNQGTNLPHHGMGFYTSIELRCKVAVPLGGGAVSLSPAKWT